MAVQRSTTATAPERHDLQYFEMFGNRGIYHKGWTAVTRHSDPVGRRPKAARASTTTSGSSTTARRTGPRRTTSRQSSPDKLRELQRLWLIEATKYNVLPTGRPHGRAPSMPEMMAGRPTTGQWADSQLLFGGMGRLAREQRRGERQEQDRSRSRPSWMMPDGGADLGVIIAQGGRFGGMSVSVPGRKGEVRLQRARPAGIFTTDVQTRPSPAGHTSDAHGVRVRRRRLTRAATSRHYDGQKVGEGRVERSVPDAFPPTKRRTSDMKPGLR